MDRCGPTIPTFYAAGDVANAFHSHYARPVRVEQWANALHGGPTAAKSMLGQPVSYDRLPYFFTNQYDVGMEYTGWFPSGGYDAVVTRSDVSGKSFHAFWNLPLHILSSTGWHEMDASHTCRSDIADRNDIEGPCCATSAGER